MSNKLFFVPYAGGSSVTFKHWIKYLEPEIDLEIFEMAGHGKRLFDDCYKSLEEASEDFYNFLKSRVSENEKYFLAGHCVGAVILYETCILINERKQFSLPERIFISGHGFVEYIHNEKKVKDMSDKEMINHFISEGGMSEEYLNEELLELIIPGMKSDVTIYEDYVFNKERNIPYLNMTVLYGEHDGQTPKNELEAWKNYSNDIDYVSFDDSHYFLNNYYEKFLDTIKGKIMEV